MITVNALVVQHQDSHLDPFDSSIVTGFVKELWGYDDDYQHHRVDLSKLCENPHFPKMILHRLEIPIVASESEVALVIVLMKKGWLENQNPFCVPLTAIHAIEHGLKDVSSKHYFKADIGMAMRFSSQALSQTGDVMFTSSIH